MALDVLVVDPHSIYRCGLVQCLRELDGVATVDEASSVEDAVRESALDGRGLVVLDYDLPGAQGLARSASERHGARVLACSARCEEDRMLSAVEAGVVGFLAKETLTPESLAGAVGAATNGNGVIATELIGSLLAGVSRVSREVLAPRGLSLARLTEREQRVLRLIADGHPTREVAEELCYSERTVKNVVHDIVTKLNARSRSQAIAHAVREGLI